MSAIYLLPCHGDNVVEITTAEAGREVRCPCGKVVTAPTLREIQQLPQKTSAVAQQQGGSNWSLQQGVLFSIGLFCLTASLLWAGWLGYQRWQLDTSEFEISQDYLEFQNEQVMAMDAADALEAWNRHLDKPLPERRRLPQFEVNRAIARTLYWKMGVAGLFGVLGIGLMVAGVLLKPRPAKPRKKPVKRPAQA